MKRAIGLTVLLSMAFLIQDLTADDYLLTANPDYYNPFALSFNYRLNPATTLKNSQFLRLRYTIDNLRTSKNIISNDIIVDAGAEFYDIYFFLKYDEKNQNMDMSIHIPRIGMSSNIGFLFPNFTSGDIGYEKKIEGDFGKKYHLMTISPLEGKIMIGNLHHQSFSYKKTSFPPLKIYITITKHTNAVGSSPKSQPIPAPAVSGKSKDELMKELREIELKYRAGKASFAELSQAQERLNEILVKERNSKKNDFTLKPEPEGKNISGARRCMVNEKERTIMIQCCKYMKPIASAVIPKLKRIVLPAGGILLLTGCLDPAREADFGCKAAAAYGNYDSAVLNITRAAEKPKVREMLREHPAAAAYYLRVLAIAEQYRGNYHESLSRTKDKAKRLAEGLVMLERELDSIGSLPHGREAGFRASLDSLKKTAEDCLK